MIPISLTLQGIYSYQERQTIDFTRLTEASIFGIFGSVGSGKSTILEAMTFALYGKTDRLNLSGDNRNYNMMNLKSNELFIELVFKTGKDDTEYMATVKGRRNSKKFDDVRTLDRAAYKKVEKEWIPVEAESLETAIGLSYENFKRTVIIPQGKFQEFLQLGNSDRTRMMKELFGLERYELFYKVVSLESRNSEQIQNIEGQLQQIGEVNPDQIKSAQDELELVVKEIDQKNTELAVMQKKEESLRKLKELTGKIAGLSQALSLLKAQEPDIAILEKAIGEYEYCLLNFKSLLGYLKESGAKVISFGQCIETDKELLKSTEEQLSDLGKSFDTLKKSYEEREQLRQQAEELEKISKINSLAVAGALLKKRISDGEVVCKNILKTIENLTESQGILTKSINEAREKLPETIRLSEAKSWFTTMESLISVKNDLSKELSSACCDLLETEKRKGVLLANDLFAGLSCAATFNEMEAELKKRREQLRLLIKEIDAQIQHLKVQSRLEEYASGLEEGKACPLCGALSHPQPLNARNVAEGIAAIQKSRDDAETDISSLEQIQKLVSEIATTTHMNQVQLGKVQLKQKEHEVKIAEHNAKFQWEEYLDEKSVNEAFANAEKLKQEIKAKGVELDAISKQLLLENNNKDRYNNVLEALRNQFTSNTSEATLLSSQIRILELSGFDGRPAEEIEREKAALLQKYSEIGNSYQKAGDAINVLQKNRDTISGRLEANFKTLEQERIAEASAVTKLQEQLDKSKYTHISEVEQILEQTLNLEQEKKRVSDFRQTMELSGKQLAELQSELGEQKYDEESYLKILDSIRLLSEEIGLKNQKQGTLKDEIKNTQAKLESQKELLERAGALRLRGEEIKTLKQLFKGSGFVNYISSVYLQELCHAANERFYKLTRQRLSLEVTEDNNFQVRDFINGGRSRNVKTLSGGQTFQAALSLALALADNIQKITKSSQNFFFLDEGFGSLDKESLDIVFETLKSLRKENRIVGVISHVEEMQQEIDTHLRIVNEEEKGSRIVCSWK